MNKQETFNTVINGLLKQGKQSKVGETCRYHSPDGLKCAVGMLIPNHLYKKEMEGCRVAVLMLKFPELRALGHDEELLRDLQIVHDLHRPDRWMEQFYSVARDHGLTYERT